MPKNNNIHLSRSDVDAILLALRIVPYADYETSTAQLDLNCLLAESVAQKLICHNAKLTPNETRLVGVSVIIARDYLSGIKDIEIPADIESDLRPFFFNYNRLAPLYEDVLHHYAQDP